MASICGMKWTRGVLLIRGRRAPIVGVVSMDMLIADVAKFEYWQWSGHHRIVRGTAR